MTLVRAALEASLTDRPFVEGELLPALPRSTRPPDGSAIALRLVDLEDRDEVTAEVRTVENSTLLLSAFADRGDAEHAYQVLQTLWDAGFDEHSRYRIHRPLALMADDALIVSAGTSGTSLARLVHRRAPEAVGMVKETGAWLGELHTADVRVGKPWLPWCNIDALAPHLRARTAVLARCRMEVREMVQRLAPLAAKTTIDSWVQTHGRFRPDRVVAGPGTVTVDDVVRSAPGDPARDIAEFIVHLRRRVALAGDPRATLLEDAFLDGYLAHAPDAYLANVPFYAGCAILLSLVTDAPAEGELPAWLGLHLEEFDRYVPSALEGLKTTA